MLELPIPTSWKSLILAVLVAVCIVRLKQILLPINRFPGPSLGYLLQHRRELKENVPWITLQQLAEKYGEGLHWMVSIYYGRSCTAFIIGDIMQISVAGTTIIVLNKATDAHDYFRVGHDLFYKEKCK